MTRLLLLACLLAAGCLDTPSLVAPDAANEPDAELDRDVAIDSDPQASNPLKIELGSREVPFEPWAEAAEVIVVQGPQGGFHTEHRARVMGAVSVDELHLAVVFGEVWRDDLVLARAGWEFWDDQWEPSGGSHELEIPVLIFDDPPEFGPAELRARLELKDGRSASYARAIDLVDLP